MVEFMIKLMGYSCILRWRQDLEKKNSLSIEEMGVVY